MFFRLFYLIKTSKLFKFTAFCENWSLFLYPLFTTIEKWKGLTGVLLRNTRKGTFAKPVIFDEKGAKKRVKYGEKGVFLTPFHRKTSKSSPQSNKAISTPAHIILLLESVICTNFTKINVKSTGFSIKKHRVIIIALKGGNSPGNPKKENKRQKTLFYP